MHPQVTAVHIYRLTYGFLISSVLYPLRGIPRGVSGWSLTPYSYLQMGQLGQTIKKMDKLRYSGLRVHILMAWPITLKGKNAFFESFFFCKKRRPQGFGPCVLVR